MISNMICEICEYPFGKDSGINEKLFCDRCDSKFLLALSKNQKEFLTSLLKELIGARLGKVTDKYRSNTDMIEYLLESLNRK